MTSVDPAGYRDPQQPTAARVEDLLARMTLAEKLAQLGGVWASELLEENRFAPRRAETALRHGTGHITRLGASTTLRPGQTAAIANAAQRYLRDHTRLGIPAIIHEESCAGYCARDATQFPQAIGLAASFEPALVTEMAEVIRAQLLAVGARQTLAPVLDVARDPRWGRVEETFGEDPYLVGRMGVAYVRGVQGSSLAGGVLATGKHFMGYGVPEGGLNWAPCSLPERERLERILPPFAAAIREAGLASIMNAYNEIDGVPCGASKELLTNLLRGTLGFDGVVVADYFTVICLMNYHGIAADLAEAAACALEAGLDVELPNRVCFAEPLSAAIEAGRVDGGLVDRAVGRVLKQKFELGLFDHPLVDESAAAAVFDTPAQRLLARKLAQKSIVLLKNDGQLLPLRSDNTRVAVLGPLAHSARRMQGDYHYPTHAEVTFGAVLEPDDAGMPAAERGAMLPSLGGEPFDLGTCFTDTVTLLAGIRALLPESAEVVHAQGCGLASRATDDADIAHAVEVARTADVAIVALGGRSGLLPGCSSGEGSDSADLQLTGRQLELLRSVVATGTPTVVVLISGRVLALGEVTELAPAIVEAWLPGEEGGHAIAEVLFGQVCPAGRLPVTFPRSVGQVPLFYNHKPSGARSMFRGAYHDLPNSPLFPFGHGLSYTRFAYRNLQITPEQPQVDGMLTVSVDVENIGDRDGEEVVQLYLRDKVATVTRPIMELKGFARIAVARGSTRRVVFELSLTQLAFYDLELAYVVEPGALSVMVGASSADIRASATVTTTGQRRVVTAPEVPTVWSVVSEPTLAERS